MKWYEVCEPQFNIPCGYAPPGRCHCNQLATYWLVVNPDEPEGIFSCDSHIGLLVQEVISDNQDESGVPQ